MEVGEGVTSSGLPNANWICDVGRVRIYGHFFARRTCHAVANRSVSDRVGGRLLVDFSASPLIVMWFRLHGL
jgi:hypothetical protein